MHNVYINATGGLGIPSHHTTRYGDWIGAGGDRDETATPTGERGRPDARPYTKETTTTTRREPTKPESRTSKPADNEMEIT